jgi:hypothetical protein
MEIKFDFQHWRFIYLEQEAEKLNSKVAAGGVVFHLKNEDNFRCPREVEIQTAKQEEKMIT